MNSMTKRGQCGAPRRGRWGLAGWTIIALGVAAALARADAPARTTPSAASQPPLARALDSVGLTVADMERSVAFFTGVLGFKPVSDVEVSGDAYERLQGVFGLRMRVVRLELGDETLELTEYLAPKGRAFPEGMRSNDRAFQHVAIIVSDMAKAYGVLRQHRVPHASTGPQRLPDWNRNAGGIEAFYFRDPDGHFLEILAFPPDKGAAKWHAAARRGERLFLGIDHTAIVVGDTEASLRFYRDQLGLGVAGESENYGIEQERLNNVFGARLRITGLRAQGGGPGVEFLEYLAPRDGRPAPADLKANDLLHWQTTFLSDGVAAAARRLFAARALFVSPGDVALPGAALGFAAGLMLRDPDGHALRLVK
jgi:catechol 2,3-dioxygenase-like lactoylglutathione lyase family enzyme